MISPISLKLLTDVHYNVTIRKDNPKVSVRCNSDLLKPSSKTNFSVKSEVLVLKVLTYMRPAK